MNCGKSPGTFQTNNPEMGTPQPHYIPGYGGHVPQKQFRDGHTFGSTTHGVLMDPCVHASPRSVLNNIHPEKCRADAIGAGPDADPYLSSETMRMDPNANRLGRQQLQPNMSPGYGGFVPRFTTILGHQNSPNCDRAVSRLEQDQWRDRLFTKELEALDVWRDCYKTKPWEVAEAGGSQGFVPPGGSGCGCGAGSVPTGPSGAVVMTTGRQTEFGAGNLCGNGQPFSILSSGRSVCDYAQRRMWGAASEPFIQGTVGDILPRLNAHRQSDPPIERVQQIYRHCEGMVPYYNGHVPGEQFRFGVTYGTATRNAKRSIEPLHHRPLCFPVRPS